MKTEIKVHPFLKYLRESFEKETGKTRENNLAQYAFWLEVKLKEIFKDKKLSL